MVVRGERPIDVIVKRLRGAAKQRWLEKWARWIDKLLDDYDVEDIQAVLGIIDPWNLDELEKFLVRHCSGLVESECLDKIEKIIREKGYTKRLSQEIYESVMDYLQYVEKRPEIEYGLPWDIRVEIQRYREFPEMDRKRAYSIVYEFLRREGCEEDEARKIAEEIARTIPKLPPRQRAEVVERTVALARVAKQRTLDEWIKRRYKAEETKKEAKKDLESFVKKLYEILAPPTKVEVPVEKELYTMEVKFEELPKWQIEILKAQRTHYPWETKGVIITWAEQRGLRPYTVDKIKYYDLVGLVVVYYPRQKPTRCWIKRDRVWIFEGCDKPVVAYLPLPDERICYIAEYR